MSNSNMMNIPLVDLKRQYQSIKTAIQVKLNHCLENTAFIGGNELIVFEENFAKFCETKYCIGCGNGTDALEIALQALGIGKNDEVIVPANSFIATAESVKTNGANVVFCDIDANSYNIDVAKIEQLITKNTKAIIAVHLYGRPADLPKLCEIAHKHNLFLIEDAAQAQGATCNGQKIGSFGTISTFSFYPGKNLGAYGDAGAIVTNDENLFLQCKKIANHGRFRAKYEHEIIGRNSRLDAMQAAVLNVKLPYLESWNKKRRQIADLYHKLLANEKNIVLPKDEKHLNSVYHLYVIRVEAAKRKNLQAFLKEKGIATGIHYPVSLPLLAAFAYKKHQKQDFPIANTYMNEVLSLPIFPELSDEEVRYISAAIIAFFNEK